MHDAGGKTKLPLLPGMTGGALISSCTRYRPLLWRAWGSSPRFWVWIGLNPSTAEGDIDDPTIRRELAFTQANGGPGYVKLNVMDYRATDPEALRKHDVVPCSADNYPTIRSYVGRADRVIAAWGAPHKSLLPYCEAVERMIREMTIPLYCVGRTQSGAPRHPLYVAAATPIERYAA